MLKYKEMWRTIFFDKPHFWRADLIASKIWSISAVIRETLDARNLIVVTAFSCFVLPAKYRSQSSAHFFRSFPLFFLLRIVCASFRSFLGVPFFCYSSIFLRPALISSDCFDLLNGHRVKLRKNHQYRIKKHLLSVDTSKEVPIKQASTIAYWYTWRMNYIYNMKTNSINA